MDISIEKVEMDGIEMGVMPSDGETVNVVLVKGGDLPSQQTVPLFT